MSDYPLQLADKTGLVCIDENQLKGVLLSEGALDPLVDAVDSIAKNLIADPMTENGRLQRRELAAKTKKVVSALDKLRKGVVEKLKDEPKTIDANVREARKRLEEIEAEVLRPLTEMDARADRLRIIADRPNILSAAPIYQLEQELATAQAMTTDEAEWKERTKEAEMVKIGLVEALEVLIAKRKQDEADRLELERLRKEKEERELRERIERETREKLAREAEQAAIAEARAKREAADAVAAEEVAKVKPAAQPAQAAKPTESPYQQAYQDIRAVIAKNGFGDLAAAILAAATAGKIRHVSTHL